MPKFASSLRKLQFSEGPVCDNMSAETLLAEANDLFVDEDFDGALEKFNAAIALNNSEGNYYTKRSACLHKLSRFSGMLVF